MKTELVSIRKGRSGRWNHHYVKLTRDNEFAIPADVAARERVSLPESSVFFKCAMMTTPGEVASGAATSCESKARVYRSWFLLVGLDLGIWAIGFGFDVPPTGFEITLGPLFVGADQE